MDREWTEDSLDKKDLGVLANMKLNMTHQGHSHAVTLTAPAASHILGCIKISMTSSLRDVTAFLVHSSETLPGILHPALGLLMQESCGSVGMSPKEGHEDNLRPGAPLPQGQVSGAVVVQPGERRPQGDLIMARCYLKGTSKKAIEELFTSSCNYRTKGNGFRLKEIRSKGWP